MLRGCSALAQLPSRGTQRQTTLHCQIGGYACSREALAAASLSSGSQEPMLVWCSKCAVAAPILQLYADMADDSC
jgi:hypothetical protein